MGRSSSFQPWMSTEYNTYCVSIGFPSTSWSGTEVQDPTKTKRNWRILLVAGWDGKVYLLTKPANYVWPILVRVLNLRANPAPQYLKEYGQLRCYLVIPSFFHKLLVILPGNPWKGSIISHTLSNEGTLISFHSFPLIYYLCHLLPYYQQESFSVLTGKLRYSIVQVTWSL